MSRWTVPLAALLAVGGAIAVAGDTDKVKISIQTIPAMTPPAKAEVRMGKKTLGLILGPRKPFILERPRDSGPLDLVIRAEGFLPLHTRAYTFSDSKLTVKLTRIADKPTLFGYRQAGPPDAGTTSSAHPDAGAVDPLIPR